MRILLLSPYYAPDLAPDAALFEMLCTDLVRAGFEVSVICAVPNYPTGRVPKEFGRKLVQRELRDGVDITRVWVPSINRANLVQRFLAVVCYQLLATMVGSFRQFDVVITVNPAFEKFIPILTLAVLRRAPLIFCVYDIYPDIGVRLGVFRHRAIVRTVGAMEEFCYAKSAAVQVLSEGHRALLRSRGIADAKLAVVRPWVDTDFIKPHPRQNEFAEKHGLANKFVVMYAGNFGLTQGLEILVQAATLLKKEIKIQFVLVGKGEAQIALEALCQSAELTNVQFISSQPRERLPSLLASADVALVMLRKGFGMDSVPSKTYSILASGRPIVAVVDQGSDTWELIRHANCGICVEPGDSTGLVKAILTLNRDNQRCAELGANGRLYAQLHHSRTAACARYKELLCSLSVEAPLQPKEDEATRRSESVDAEAPHSPC